jgi:hypothetical protein
VVNLNPTDPAALSRWVLARRGPKNAGLDPYRPYAFLHEEEAGPNGDPVPTATIFLTNRECPLRCVMCDLWQNTLDVTVPSGAIPAQIDHALERLPPTARQVKLYNAGSFFDPNAIPPGDLDAVAARVSRFERVIVECHPRFLDTKRDAVLRFRDALGGARLEIAVGLETVHPAVLARLNKRMTVDDFRRAGAFLREHDTDLRVFLLVRPPFLSEAEGVEWACRSLDVAFDEGASVCALIPTRAGNGAMDDLQREHHFMPPSLGALEAAQRYGLGLSRGRVFADLWDAGKFAVCPDCSPGRVAALEEMNRTQHPAPPVSCAACDGAAA